MFSFDVTYHILLKHIAMRTLVNRTWMGLGRLLVTNKEQRAKVGKRNRVPVFDVNDQIALVHVTIPTHGTPKGARRWWGRPHKGLKAHEMVVKQDQILVVIFHGGRRMGLFFTHPGHKTIHIPGIRYKHEILGDELCLLGDGLFVQELASLGLSHKGHGFTDTLLGDSGPGETRPARDGVNVLEIGEVFGIRQE
jgi:hypothetical protein